AVLRGLKHAHRLGLAQQPHGLLGQAAAPFGLGALREELVGVCVDEGPDRVGPRRCRHSRVPSALARYRAVTWPRWCGKIHSGSDPPGQASRHTGNALVAPASIGRALPVDREDFGVFGLRMARWWA